MDLKKLTTAVIFLFFLSTGLSALAESNDDDQDIDTSQIEEQITEQITGQLTDAIQGGINEIMEPFIFGRPGHAKQVIKLKKYIHYVGDTIEIEVKLPDRLKSLVENGTADVHLAVVLPSGVIINVALDSTDWQFSADLDTTTFETGHYQLAVILTKDAGNPLELGDWYKGFSGLISTKRIKITDVMPGEDAEDQDGDGMGDNADEDGFDQGGFGKDFFKDDFFNDDFFGKDFFDDDDFKFDDDDSEDDDDDSEDDDSDDNSNDDESDEAEQNESTVVIS